jgi:hypothetical protein
MSPIIDEGFRIMIAQTEFTATYLPTLSEIREECAAIRREWSVRERATRRADRSKAWQVLVAPHPHFDRSKRFEI